MEKEIRQDMINELNQILKETPFDIDKYNEARLRFSMFCYENDLSVHSQDLRDERLERMFVVESSPINYDVDSNSVSEVADKIKGGMPLTEDEVSVMLEYVVKLARDKFSEDYDLEYSSLCGCCGYGQAATYFPLNKLGVKTTVNNASRLPDSNYRHAFLTCTFDVIENGQVSEKQYLIDTTYRQFFTTLKCHVSRFYDGTPGFKDNSTPDPGYFLKAFDDGYNFAQELLQKGFIELTVDNARLYGLGFSSGSASFKNSDRRKEIISHTGQEYIDAINDYRLEEEVDYNFEEIYEADELETLGISNKVY